MRGICAMAGALWLFGASGALAQSSPPAQLGSASSSSIPVFITMVGRGIKRFNT